MTSSEIRQSFLDFFKSKQHEIVPSSSLMPDAPNLLFTNAGMNQFVPIFLGERACPYRPGRAADTQKCIRAGGKHNDLEDVGLDTYHHTFFEMLGNWSFGDYFKKEAIDWAWELLTSESWWGFPKERLYATVYSPDASQGDPSEFDQEAYDLWAAKFSEAGLDPKIHIVRGNKKDNFWMMGDTGPCGPCSEVHMDLTPDGDTKGRLVNQDSERCIEIWNLVFIQFNANPDGSFTPLSAKHVDTGMGFERVASIIQNTKKFSDFSGTISNYETDVFRPLFDALESMSGKRYAHTLPVRGTKWLSERENIDVAFRVIADHIRTLSFSIADGILPGNTDRNYVLRRILRRAVRYGRLLGFNEPFFWRLTSVLAENMGEVFPEVRARQEFIETTLRMEEEAFNRTLDRGIKMFKEATESLKPYSTLSGAFAFKLYDTYGFPLDLTQLMARERGLVVEQEEFDRLMEEQRAQARASQQQEVISVSNIDSSLSTEFTGYDALAGEAEVLDAVQAGGQAAVVVDQSPFYAAMGGQVGDQGVLRIGDRAWKVVDTQKQGNAFLHVLENGEGMPEKSSKATLQVDADRRFATQRHHTVTHLLHWALHEVIGPDATQKGSYVGPDKLTFDFNSAAMTEGQTQDVERLVNERILENGVVCWTEMPYAEVKERPDILQFFGDKYGDRVRVVQIGGRAGELNGYSMELCGGTHVRATGELGCLRILGESAVAAGIRRIEAVSGFPALEEAREESMLVRRIAGRVNAPVSELEKKVEALLKQQKDLEKQLKQQRQKNAAASARELLSEATAIGGLQFIGKKVEGADGETLQTIADSLKGQFKGVILLMGSQGGSVSLVATVPPELTKKVRAGSLIQAVAPLVGGKGGGKPENARGGGKDPSKIEQALEKAREWLKEQA